MKNIIFKKNILLFVSCVILILFFDLWKYYPNYGSYLFQDWTYIFDFNICSNKKYISEFFINICPVILEHNFVYPDIWLNLINIFENRNYFKYLILLFIIIYIFVSFEMLKGNKIIYFALFIFSPVSILITQRGNNDLIIFLLIYLFYFSLKNNKNILISLIPFNLAIIAKIYPAILLPIYISLNKHINLKSLFYIILLLSFSISLYFSNLFDLISDYNKSGIILAFSSTTIIKIFNFITGYNVNYNFISIFILSLIILFSSYSKYNLPNCDEKKELSFLIGSAIIVGSFFLNEGFVYKLIFLIFNISYFLDLKEKVNKKIYNYFVIIIFLSLWIEYLTYILEFILNIDFAILKSNPEINIKNSIYGVSIVLKNIVYWLLNLNLVFVSTKIFLKNLKFIKF